MSFGLCVKQILGSPQSSFPGKMVQKLTANKCFLFFLVWQLQVCEEAIESQYVQRFQWGVGLHEQSVSKGMTRKYICDCS